MISKYQRPYIISAIMFTYLACQKSGTVPFSTSPAALTVVNVIPNSWPVIPVINSSTSIVYFSNAQSIGYGSSYEYSPNGGTDTIYVVQNNSDTTEVDRKSGRFMFYGTEQLAVGGIYSLFLTGSDTSSPDYLLTLDSLPYHGSSDSTVGIRFVNLSAGSNPMSVNLEGGSNGSEVSNLPYKAITGFRKYFSNSMLSDSAYLFVFRDVATGDSLTSFSLYGAGSGNGIGLVDPNNSSNVLTFKNITIAIYGSENSTGNSMLNVMVINYF